MGSACSPVIANFFIERFEQQAVSSATNPPKIWLKYVDDTFLILKKYEVHDFTSHINRFDLNIKFTTKHNNKKSSAKDKPIGPSNSSATGRNPFVVLPYLEGLSQRNRKVFLRVLELNPFSNLTELSFSSWWLQNTNLIPNIYQVWYTEYHARTTTKST